jgi:hypothetical protein
MRLEHGQKSGVISVDFILTMTLISTIQAKDASYLQRTLNVCRNFRPWNVWQGGFACWQSRYAG